MRRFRSLGLAAVLVLGASAGARAQAVVPGGWSPQVGYRSFGGVAVASPPVYGGYGYGGYGTGYGGFSNGGYPTYPAYGYASGGFSGYVQPPRVVNGLGPLGNTIRQTTRRRGR